MFKRIYTLLALMLALIPFYSNAASLEYSSFTAIDHPSQTIVIRYGGLESKAYYTCAISTFACTFSGSSTAPTFPAATSTANPFSIITDSRAVYRGVSPDQRFVFYYRYANQANPTRSFVLIDTQTNKKYTKSSPVAYWDLLTEENRLFSVAPDSKTLIYLDDRSGYSTLYKVDLTNLKTTSMDGVKLFSRTYAIADFMFTDPQTILFIANRENANTWNLYRYDIKTQALTLVENNVSYAEPMRKIGDYALYLKTKGNSIVPKGYSISLKNTRDFALAQSAGITEVKNSYELVKYGNVTGVLLTPTVVTAAEKKTPRPLIIWLHGGPHRTISNTIHPYLSYGVYDWSLEEARRNGAIVLKIDYRGSYGHGRDFAEALKGYAGIRDVADIETALAGVKKTLGKSYTISGSYLVGNSYGGYLALKGLVEAPKSFAGAYSINGVTDWPTLLTKLNTSIFNVYFDGLPTLKNSKLYSQADIVDSLAAVTTQKMLLVHAEDDRDVDDRQSDFFTEVATAKDKNVELIKIPGEDHVFRKNSSITTICKSLLTFTGLTANTPDRCNFQ